MKTKERNRGGDIKVFEKKKLKQLIGPYTLWDLITIDVIVM